MVKAHCVIIDMNLIVVCERIMELQPSKKMMMNELLPIVDSVMEDLSGHIIFSRCNKSS